MYTTIHTPLYLSVHNTPMRLLITILILFVTISVYSQTDTIPNFKYKNTFYLGARGETGWNRSWFQSIGISYLGANATNTHGVAHFVIYSAAEINLAAYNSPASIFYGYKSGLEFGTNGTTLGIEIRGYTDFKGKEHTISMPKAGISLFGYANITYGYNVFQDDCNVFGIGHHQIAFSVNIARKLFTESFIPE